MAVTELYNRTTNLNGLIEYVMNGDKTDEMKYVSGINCLPETAYEEMMSTKNRFNKGKESQAWYYRSGAASLIKLGEYEDTKALYLEFAELVDKVF